MRSDDITRAVQKLRVLGGGFDIIGAGECRLIRSVPCELNADHNSVIAAAERTGYTVASELQRLHQWSRERTMNALVREAAAAGATAPLRADPRGAAQNQLLHEGMVWVDGQDAEPRYWFPSLWSHVHGERILLE